MASPEILSQTLHSITSIKLHQLHKQKAAYESAKRSLLDDAAFETENKKRAKILIEGAKELPTMASLEDRPMISLKNLCRFVQQADFDPSISDSFILDYESTMRNELDVQSAKYRFAELYGKLVNEWISAGGANDTDSDSGFVPIGREEMHEQRATWEDYAFRAKETDVDAIKAYLENLFATSSKDSKNGLTKLRDFVKRYQKHWQKKTHFNEVNLRMSIEGLLRTDLLTDQKRKTLSDFLGNDVVLQEFADVLNMRMQTWKTWQWDDTSLIDIRRQLNGRYRFYPDEDLLQILFIRHIGMSWSIEMRSWLEGFTRSAGVWKPALEPISKEDLRRRRFFLFETDRPEKPDAMEGTLEKHFMDEIFLDNLEAGWGERRGAYGDDGEEATDTRKSHAAVVQKLLHILQSEILIDTRLGKEVTVLRSDFKWFGPSIPHSTIFAVLSFLGVNEEWIDFFRRILEAPIRFTEDPADTPVRIRKRGTPISTPLADFMAETILFCLDFAVNKKADGLRLYRLHDDMWLWGSVEKCQKGWKAMTEFAGLMGLDFNEDKTGCVRVLRNGAKPGPHPRGLPEGDVIWGFLQLDPVTGRFLINQDQVDKHTEELRLQLKACKSVFDLIQAWNAYGSRFFITNFGKLAQCCTREHVDSMLATFSRIQEKLFGKGGGIGAHLKQMISARFNVSADEIPDGFLYFPTALGGLGLQNPFINLYVFRENVHKNPDKMIDKKLETDGSLYRRAKARFEGLEEANVNHRDRAEFADLKNEAFMSREEFDRYRSRTSLPLGEALKELCEVPSPKPLEAKADVKAAMGDDSNQWYNLSEYEKWVCSLYTKDIVTKFGSMVIIDEGLLPMGLMDMLRQSRFRWQI